jgi:hypothetical protein
MARLVARQEQLKGAKQRELSLWDEFKMGKDARPWEQKKASGRDENWWETQKRHDEVDK